MLWVGGLGVGVKAWFNVRAVNPFEAEPGIKDYTNNRHFVLLTWENK